MKDCNIEIKPYSISRSSRKEVKPFGISCVNQDYWGFKNRMLEYIRKNRQKDFNDFTESSIVVMFTELVAFLADTLSFKVDQVGNEMFPDTVTEPENMMRLAKLMGFKPTPPTPSKAMFIGKISAPLDTDLVIQTPVSASYGIPGVGSRSMELFPADNNNNPLIGQPIIIPAGSVSNSNIVGIEGRSSKLHVDAPGSPKYVVHLGDTNILKGSINIYVDDVAWEEVEYFTEPAPQYIVEYNAQYQAAVIFGDNDAGLAPPKGSKILITYRTGGGTVGNITTGSINSTTRIAVNGLPYMVVVEFNNYTKGEYGYDGDTIEDIRRKMPIWINTQNRAVTGEDYKALAELFTTNYNGSIGKATAGLRNSGCSGNIIDLYILSHSGQGFLSKPNDNLKSELANYINDRKMLTDYVCIRDGEILFVDINLDIMVPSIYRRTEDKLREKISQRLTNYFSLSNWEFGKPLKESDIVKSLSDIKEIDQIDVTFLTVEGLETGEGSSGTIYPKFNEIVRPDNLVFYFNYN